jgi:hypothetical protein
MSDLTAICGPMSRKYGILDVSPASWASMVCYKDRNNFSSDMILERGIALRKPSSYTEVEKRRYTSIF